MVGIIKSDNSVTIQKITKFSPESIEYISTEDLDLLLNSIFQLGWDISYYSHTINKVNHIKFNSDENTLDICMSNHNYKYHMTGIFKYFSIFDQIKQVLQ